MIDEVAEVKQYLDGKGIEDAKNIYRACYMITKYYKKLGLSRKDAFLKVAEWVRQYDLTFDFSLISCVSAAYDNEVELRCGTTVRISRADAESIKMYARNKAERRVALALMCCAKAMAEHDGSFVASSSALASWLGMDAGNLQRRQLKHLQDYGFMERVDNNGALKGWKKNYYRAAYRFRLLVPFSNDGEWELEHNDIRRLYGQVFGEPYENPCVNG